MASVRRLTMELIKLTIGSVKAHGESATSRKQIWLSDNDGGRGGGRLMLRVTLSGSHFYFRYTADGTKKVVPIGRYSERPHAGCYTLAEARATFAEYSRLYQAPETQDVRQHVQAKFRRRRNIETDVASSFDGTPESTPPADSLMALCNAYVRDLQQRGRISWKEVAGMFRRHVAQTEHASRPANSITKKDITNILRPLKHAPDTQKHLRAGLHAAYELAVHAEVDAQTDRSFVEFNVELNAVSGTKPIKISNSKSQKHFLSRLELGHLWNHLLPSDVEAPVGLSVRFMRLDLLLGGQRGEQLISVTLDRVDLEIDTVLIYDMKGRDEARKHLLPLIPAAKAEMEWLMEYAQERDSNYLFPGKLPGTRMQVGAPQLYLKRLSERMKRLKETRSSFSFADIRRTVETQMASLSVSRDVRGQIQSHGLHGVQENNYDMWEYIPQKRATLELWHQQLNSWGEQARKQPRNPLGSVGTANFDKPPPPIGRE